jgi:Tol biopolymer transport system component
MSTDLPVQPARIARAWLALAAAWAACAHAPGGLGPGEEAAFDDLRRLTFGGNNADPAWSSNGNALAFQGPAPEGGCRQLFRVEVLPRAGVPAPIAAGGRAEALDTAEVRFLPGGDLVFASTRAGLAGCDDHGQPPRAAGHDAAWALSPASEIFRAKPDGSAVVRLTDNASYDGEAAVCARDGSIVFTSTRDGDPELYRMDGAGNKVRRLTNNVGYDGDAAFNADCSRLVWRASRPRPGREQDDYRASLTRGQVSAAQFEIWAADGDGGDPHQLTDLDATSFAPGFHPTEDVIVFTSNAADPQRTDFDLWAMHGNGTGLARLTHTAGFDGQSHFSPDGRWLAFSSQRSTGVAADGDRDLFIARWKRLPALSDADLRPGDRIQRDISWLAHKDRAGRGVGSEGLAAAGAYLERRLRDLGAAPAGDGDGFRQAFPIVTAVSVKPGSGITLAGLSLGADQFLPLGFSASSSGAATSAPVVLAGYGIVSPEHQIDDYAGLDVRGKVVLVRRFAPEDDRTRDAGLRRELGDLRRKAQLARERGALALLVVDWPLPPAAAAPDWQPDSEATLAQPGSTGGDDAGIPVVMIKRTAVAPVMSSLLARKLIVAQLNVDLEPTTEIAFNVVGRFAAAQQPAAGTIVIGAHYDHLGLGGRYSLAPGRHEPHLGADDNASGTATALEVARQLAAHRTDLKHDVVVALFSGEESGLLGSAFFAHNRHDVIARAVAMLNLDMVGRLRDGHLDVYGSETALEWPSLLRAACGDLHLNCVPAGDGQGPSDQASFYSAGVPVLHFFTGTHGDYHKPSDSPDRIFPTGAARVAELTTRVIHALDAGITLSYQKGSRPPPTAGDLRIVHASLGTIPDYAGPPAGQTGVLLSGVRAGSGADRAGMRRGDILIRLGERDVRSVEDLLVALQAARPGDTTLARIVRAGKQLDVEATFQESRRGP